MKGKKMLRQTSVFLLLAASACTYAQVSATPVQLSDGTTGYRYTGRSNFSHQMAEADRVMAATCDQFGGWPVVIQQSERNIGGGAMFTGNTIIAGANRQQDIIFKCVN